MLRHEFFQLEVIEFPYISDYDDLLGINTFGYGRVKQETAPGAQFAFDTYNSVVIPVEENEGTVRLSYAGVLSDVEYKPDSALSVYDEMLMIDPVTSLRYWVAWLQVDQKCVCAAVSRAIDLNGETTNQSYPSGALLVNQDLAQLNLEVASGRDEWCKKYAEDLCKKPSETDLLPGGIGPGAKIRTENGYADVGDLEVGDLVYNDQHGLSSIEWIGSASSPSEIIYVPKQALGGTEDLYLAPRHRILFRSRRVEHVLGWPEVLVPVECLVGWRGVKVTQSVSVQIYNVLLGKHSVIQANGVLIESMAPREIVQQAALSSQAFGLRETINALSSITPTYCKPIVKSYELPELL